MPGETAAPGQRHRQDRHADGADRRHQLQRDRQRGRRELEPRSAPSPTPSGSRSSDANATLPANAAWSRAPRPSRSPPRPPAARTVHRDRHHATAAKTANTSPATTINAGAFAKLQLLMPGETAAPGHRHRARPARRPRRPRATRFNVTVNAVDANWNLGQHRHRHRRRSPAQRPERDPARQRRPGRGHEDLRGHAQDRRQRRPSPRPTSATAPRPPTRAPRRRSTPAPSRSCSS